MKNRMTVIICTLECSQFQTCLFALRVGSC